MLFRHNVVVIYFFCTVSCLVQMATYFRIRKVTNQLDGVAKETMFDQGKVVEVVVNVVLILCMIPGMWVR